jgi:hypothetical protein
MIGEIESGKPEYIVMVLNRYSWLFKESSDTEILAWAQKYTAEHYDRIGIVDFSSEAHGVELWGDAAKNYQGRREQFLEIYKRKPPPE